MSMEFGIVEAMRLASDSTKGRLATMRRLFVAEAVWSLMPARYRNRGTNSPVCVPELATETSYWRLSYLFRVF
jgi:hypothetical protein